uniref:Probable choline kinase 1 n=1 Tax=Tanacetum cinerariifolium TaxID=118510 RepID=A0A699L4F5_TANCI|nr:probable choline kinase 1 [Tanacetum cinerariifolium]
MAVKINGFIEATQSEGLIKLLLSLPSNWGDVFDTSKLIVVHLSGAMTNVVYRITWPKNGSENDDRTVLVRVYGKVCERRAEDFIHAKKPVKHEPWLDDAGCLIYQMEIFEHHVMLRAVQSPPGNKTHLLPSDRECKYKDASMRNT